MFVFCNNFNDEIKMYLIVNKGSNIVFLTTNDLMT